MSSERPKFTLLISKPRYPLNRLPLLTSLDMIAPATGTQPGKVFAKVENCAMRHWQSPDHPTTAAGWRESLSNDTALSDFAQKSGWDLEFHLFAEDDAARRLSERFQSHYDRWQQRSTFEIPPLDPDTRDDIARKIASTLTKDDFPNTFVPRPLGVEGLMLVLDEASAALSPSMIVIGRGDQMGNLLDFFTPAAQEREWITAGIAS